MERKAAYFTKWVAQAKKAADDAVKRTFAIFGVDIDKPEQVERFRSDLRFGGSIHRYTERGTMVFVGIVAGCIALALGWGMVSVIMATWQKISCVQLPTPGGK